MFRSFSSVFGILRVVGPAVVYFVFAPFEEPKPEAQALGPNRPDAGDDITKSLAVPARFIVFSSSEHCLTSKYSRSP